MNFWKIIIQMAWTAQTNYSTDPSYRQQLNRQHWINLCHQFFWVFFFIFRFREVVEGFSVTLTLCCHYTLRWMGKKLMSKVAYLAKVARFLSTGIFQLLIMNDFSSHIFVHFSEWSCSVDARPGLWSITLARGFLRRLAVTFRQHVAACILGLGQTKYYKVQ